MNTKALQAADAAIRAVGTDPSTSDWLRSALMASTRRDIVDAVNDADILYVLLNARFQAMLDADQANVEAEAQQDYINRFERHC